MIIMSKGWYEIQTNNVNSCRKLYRIKIKLELVGMYELNYLYLDYIKGDSKTGLNERKDSESYCLAEY